MGLNWFFFHLAYNKFRLTLIMYTTTLLWLCWWWWLLLLFLWLLSNSTAIIIVAICVVIVYGTFRCIDKVPFQFIFTGACFTDCQRFNSSEIFTNAMLIVHFHSPWYKFVFVVFISCFMSSICFVIVLFFLYRFVLLTKINLIALEIFASYTFAYHTQSELSTQHATENFFVFYFWLNSTRIFMSSLEGTHTPLFHSNWLFTFTLCVVSSVTLLSLSKRLLILSETKVVNSTSSIQHSWWFENERRKKTV